MFLVILNYLLIAVEVVTSLLLLGVILIQRTKSQGMTMGGLAIGAGMGESLFGAQVGNVLTRTTVVLAGIFLVNTTILAVIGTGHVKQSVTQGIRVNDVPAAAMPAAPAGETSGGQDVAPLAPVAPPADVEAGSAPAPIVPAPAARTPAAPSGGVTPSPK